MFALFYSNLPSKCRKHHLKDDWEEQRGQGQLMLGTDETEVHMVETEMGTPGLMTERT